MTPDHEKQIKEFNAKRDAVLLTGDFQKVRQFAKENGGNMPDTEVGQAAMHKAITAIRSLPLELRKISYKWLIERNYTSYDDGELKE